MTALRRRATVAAAAIVLLPGCSSSTTAHHPPSKPAAPRTRAAALDSCVVGTWTSTDTHGTVSNSANTVHIPIGGGAGEIAVIRADGVVALNYSSAQPETGQGSDGATYTITTTGSLLGHLAAAGGKATLTIDDPTSATQVIARNGTVVDRSAAARRLPSTYTCGSGKLAVTTGGLTTDWVKYSGASASAPVPSSAPATTSGTVVRAPITNAIFARDTLLAQADGTQIDSRNIPAGWEHDELDLFAGTAYPADPHTISGGYSFITSKVKNIDYLAFAVRDTSGRCAAGLLVANSSSTRVEHAQEVALPAGATCRGDVVAQTAGYL